MCVCVCVYSENRERRTDEQRKRHHVSRSLLCVLHFRTGYQGPNSEIGVVGSSENNEQHSFPHTHLIQSLGYFLQENSCVEKSVISYNETIKISYRKTSVVLGFSVLFCFFKM